MKTIAILAGKELRDGLRNRWVAASVLLLTALALSLAFLGAAPGGDVKASMLSVTVASVTSLSVYLVPLIALMLSYDTLIGEFERGTMLLLLTYPVARWQVILGKFAGHMGILTLAIVGGYGSAAAVVALFGGSDAAGWQAFGAMIASSLLLAAAFVALGTLISCLAGERAMAAGLAIALWLVIVVVYDLLLLGVLLADAQQIIGEGAFALLLLVNPTDAFRLFNLTAFEEVRLASGFVDIGDKAGIGLGASLAVLAMWSLLPLATVGFLFQRREL